MTIASTWQFTWLPSWDVPADLNLRGGDSHVFFQPELIRAWVETYRPLRHMEPRFLVATPSADNTHSTSNVPRPTIFLPLVLDRGGWKDAWLRVLQPVGHNEFDYHDPIMSMKEWTDGRMEEWGGSGSADGSKVEASLKSTFWAGFAEEIRRSQSEFDLFSIPRLRQSSRSDLDTQVSGFSPHSCEKAPFIDLSKHASFDAFMMSRSGNLRQGLKRKQKKLAAQGTVEFKVYKPEETSQALEALAAFRKSHEVRWPRAYRAPWLFENLIRHALPAGLLHLSTIQCAGQTASWHFGFLHNRRFYWYIPAYDDRFSQFSPGLIHIARLVEECYTLGVTVFDFLRGEERYKYEWTEDEAHLSGFEFANSDVASRARSSTRKLLRGAAALVRR